MDWIGQGVTFSLVEYGVHVLSSVRAKGALDPINPVTHFLTIDGDDIEAAYLFRPSWIPGQEPGCCPGNPVLLVGIDCIDAAAVVCSTAVFYLDKNQWPSIFHDQVDLTESTVEVPLYQRAPLSTQIRLRNLFPV
jgi:hypothetical protein